MTNAQLKALRTLAHQKHDVEGDKVAIITRTSSGFEVKRAGKVIGVVQTWEGANELAGVA